MKHILSLILVSSLPYFKSISLLFHIMFFFFFFQAEDGIRVDLVTGVQTCALPISPRNRPFGGPRFRSATACATSHVISRTRRANSSFSSPEYARRAVCGAVFEPQIGRASCRERV